MKVYLAESKDLSAPIAFKKDARKSLNRKEGGGFNFSTNSLSNPNLNSNPNANSNPNPNLNSNDPNLVAPKPPDINGDEELQKPEVAYCGTIDRDEVANRLLACPDKTYLVRWSHKTGFVLSYNEKGKILHVSGLKRVAEGLLVVTPGGQRMCNNLVEYLDIMKGKNIIANPITKYMDIENGYVFLKVWVNDCVTGLDEMKFDVCFFFFCVVFLFYFDKYFVVW